MPELHTDRIIYFMYDFKSSILQKLDIERVKMEKRYTIVVVAFLIAILSVIHISQKYFSKIYMDYNLKFLFLVVIIVFLVLHFFLKNTYFILNKRFDSIIRDSLDLFKKNNPENYDEYIVQLLDELKDETLNEHCRTTKIFYLNLENILSKTPKYGEQE